jgi:hypothetical protein
MGVEFIKIEVGWVKYLFKKLNYLEILKVVLNILCKYFYLSFQNKTKLS